MTSQAHALGEQHAIKWLLENDEGAAAALLDDIGQVVEWLLEDGWEGVAKMFGLNGLDRSVPATIARCLDEYMNGWAETANNAIEDYYRREPIGCPVCGCPVCRGRDVSVLPSWQDVVRQIGGSDAKS